MPAASPKWTSALHILTRSKCTCASSIKINCCCYRNLIVTPNWQDFKHIVANKLILLRFLQRTSAMQRRQTCASCQFVLSFVAEES